MKFKNLLVGVLALSTLVLSGCGSSGETSTDSGTDSQTHEHDYKFKSFVWTETPGAYTAKAKYVCKGDESHVEYYDAEMSKTTDAASCTETGTNHWKATYNAHEDTKDETLAALGHDWEVSWNWIGLHDTAVATFTCKRDANHTHQETATFAGGSIVKFDHRDVTCTVDGYDKYRATVTFNGQTYTDEKTEMDYAVGHIEDEDNYGFCENCSEYAGVELTHPDQVYNFNNMPAGKYFFRFPVNNHYIYEKAFTGDLQEGWFNFYAQVDEIWKPITISSATYDPIEQPDDGYVYLVLIVTAKVDYSSFKIDFKCSHNTSLEDVNIDSHGFCSYCHDFAGLTINQIDWDEEFELPNLDTDEFYFVRAKASTEQHISFGSDDQWPQGCGFDFYLRKAESGSDPIYTEVEDFCWYNMSQPRTLTNDFFYLPDEDNDGYLYIKITNDDQSETGTGCMFTIVTSHEASWSSEQGQCVADGCEAFGGTTVNIAQFNNNQTYKISKDKPAFFRYVDLWHGHQKDSDYLYTEYKVEYMSGATAATFYYRKNGIYKSFTMNDTWAQLPEKPDDTDPHIYVKLICTADGSITGTLRLNYRLPS